MEKLYEYLKGDEWVVIITAIISLYAAIVMFFMTYTKSRMHRRKSKWVEAYDLILKGIEQKTLASNDDVFLIYKRLVQNYSANSSYVDFLESLLITVQKMIFTKTDLYNEIKVRIKQQQLGSDYVDKVNYINSYFSIEPLKVTVE